MHGDDSDRALVETIIAMARSLRMDVVAEGVENALQLESLHGMGCRFAQGYFFAPPLAIDELDARFTETAGPSRPTLPTPDATPA